MDLYFPKGYTDVAATTLADLNALFAALADPSTSANAAAIDRITNRIPCLTQSDSGEPLNLYFYDTPGNVSSWVTDATVTLSVGLGTPDPAGGYLFSSTSNFTAASPRVGTLALNSSAILSALTTASAYRRTRIRFPNQIVPGDGATRAEFFLQVRKATAAVLTETLSMLTVSVQAGVLAP